MREVVAAASPDEGRSAWRISHELTWSRSWDAVGSFGRRMAMAETLAHLFSLRRAGVAARAEQIRLHHEERMREVVAATSAGERRSAWWISRELTWSRSWDDLGPFGRRMAMAETLAHLFSLRGAGVVTMTEDDGVWWWLRAS
jgi:hypothetical protein